MTFTYPLFLYALSAVLIPIIIHLFNFRIYKTVYFSDISFLRNIKEQTKSKSELKHLLILLSRILTVVALVFAFAQPFIPVNEKNSSNEQAIGIYVDNSFSTQSESKYGKLSSVATDKALSIVKAYPDNTEYIFSDNSFDSKHNHFTSSENIKNFISEIQPAPSVRTVSSIVSRMTDLLEPGIGNKNKTIYLISDFSKNITDFENLKNEENTNIVFIPLVSQTQNNIYIDSVWFENPNRLLDSPDEIFVKITNSSDESYNNIPLKLYLNDTLKTPGSFNIEAKSSKIEKLVFTNKKTGIIKGRVEISDYPITYDNTFYFSFSIAEHKKVLVIGATDANKYISGLFSDNNYFELTQTTEDNVKASEMMNYDVIIYNAVKHFSSGAIQEFVNFISSGGTGVIFCNINTTFDEYNILFNKLNVNYITGIDTTNVHIEKLNYGAEIYKNAFSKIENQPDLPAIYKRVKFSSITNTNENVLLWTKNNEKILSESNFGTGKVYVFSLPADKTSSNFVVHPLWSPTLYNIVSFGNKTDRVFYTIGEQNIINVASNMLGTGEVYRITDAGGKTDFIPRTLTGANGTDRILISENILESGNYTLRSSSKNITGLAFNYNRLESELEQYKPEEISSKLEEYKLTKYSVINEEKEFLSDKIKNNKSGKELWKIFIILSLIFIAMEIILVRFLRN